MLKYQLHIRNATTADSARVADTLLAAAVHFKWTDNTENSRVENTIKSFADRKFYGDGIGARQVGDTIVLDFNQRTQNSERIEGIYELVSAQIKSVFKDRFVQPEKNDFMPVSSTLPITPEMRSRAVDSLKRKFEF